MEYTTNAPKGAAYLDTVRPGWADRIDLDIFDITMSECCVIGQLYEDYPEGRAELFGIEPNDYEPEQRANDREAFRLSVMYGFDRDFGVNGNSRTWQAEWENLIRERQSA